MSQPDTRAGRSLRAINKERRKAEALHQDVCDGLIAKAVAKAVARRQERLAPPKKIEWVDILRNHSGIPRVHYHLPLSDQHHLLDCMQKCGIGGTVEDVIRDLALKGFYHSIQSNGNPSAYWIGVSRP